MSPTPPPISTAHPSTSATVCQRERHFVQARDLALGESELRGYGERGDGKRHDDRRHPKHDPFHDEPLGERERARAKGERDRDLLARALGAEEEEVDDVRRRDEQHERDQHAEQYELRADGRHRGSLQRLHG